MKVLRKCLQGGWLRRPRGIHLGHVLPSCRKKTASVLGRVCWVEMRIGVQISAVGLKQWARAETAMADFH